MANDMINEIRKIRQKHQKKIIDVNFTKYEIIYHYTTPEAFLNIIQNGKLWFSDINYLNDESEMFYAYELLKSILNKNQKQIRKELCKLIEEKIEQILNKEKPESLFKYLERRSYFLASFSIDCDNLSLWNYYTKNQNLSGYNIGFSKNIIHKLSHNVAFKSFFFSYGKVIYDEKIQKQMLKKALYDYNQLFKKASSQKDKVGIRDSFLGLVLAFSLFFKQNCFAAEREYRIVIDQPIDPLKKEERFEEICHRLKSGLIIPYIECDVMPEDVFETYISPTTKAEYYKDSTENFLITSDFTRTRVYNSQIPLRY